jgi:predicted methyltransferase
MHRQVTRGFAALFGLLAAAGVLAADVKIPEYIKAAVASPSRPDADRARDVNRKPEVVLSFAGVKPGEQIGELMPGGGPGGGYYTRLLCQIAGPSGHVYTLSFAPAVKRAPPPPDAPIAAPPTPNPCMNVTEDTKPAAEAALPPDLDLVWTSENYHDFHNPMFGSPDMKALDTVIYNALKPGGLFIVEDHAAAPGSGARDTNTLHRIDPELVKQEVTSVGFVFVAASDVLHNPTDTHEAKVFSLAGKSDKFLFKFRRPKP